MSWIFGSVHFLNRQSLIVLVISSSEHFLPFYSGEYFACLAEVGEVFVRC